MVDLIGPINRNQRWLKIYIVVSEEESPLWMLKDDVLPEYLAFFEPTEYFNCIRPLAGFDNFHVGCIPEGEDYE